MALVDPAPQWLCAGRYRRIVQRNMHWLVSRGPLLGNDEAIYMSDRILILTPRPGRIDRTISVDIQRPRDRSRTEFLRLRSEILQLLHLAGNASVEQ